MKHGLVYLMMTVLVAVSAFADLETNLIDYYPMDDFDMTDHVGSNDFSLDGNVQTIYNSSGRYPFGTWNYHFNGLVNQQAYFEDVDLPDEFTICSWVKVTNLDEISDVFIGHKDWVLTAEQSTLSFQSSNCYGGEGCSGRWFSQSNCEFNGCTWLSYSASATIPDTEYHFICIVRNLTYSGVLFDGSLVNSTEGVFSNDTELDVFFLTQGGSGQRQVYDEMRIWSRVLDNSEVYSLYSSYPCYPDWSCTGYGACLPNSTQQCNEVVDLNVCGESYAGDYSEFSPLPCTPASTGYTPDYTAGDLSSITGDVIGEAGQSLKVNIPLIILGAVALFASGIVLAIRARFK